MIFASDLDQTLIYSINFLNKHYSSYNDLLKESLTLVEYYEGKPLCYMHNFVLERLKILSNEGVFVPVTTRTEEQYKRIEFLKYGVSPEYAVTTNGAKVLKDGKVDPKWKVIIDEKYKTISLKGSLVEEIIKDVIPCDVIKKVRTAENVFSYCVLNRSLFDTNLIQVLREQLGSNWNLSLQGTKLYCMPKVISKWDAVAYVCEQVGVSKVVAAGDSLLDIPLLKNAYSAIIPSHGEIFDQQLQDKYDFLVSDKSGVESSISIVNLIEEKRKS